MGKESKGFIKPFKSIFKKKIPSTREKHFTNLQLQTFLYKNITGGETIKDDERSQNADSKHFINNNFFKIFER